MKRLVMFTLSILPLLSIAQSSKSYPAHVEAVLKQAGKNRTELENAIDHYRKSGDSLKAKAIQFLVGNMDIHYSASYYWVDSTGKKVPFNELDYPDFSTALNAFEEIKKKTPKIHPVPVMYRDIDNLDAGFLIDNVDRAFEAWKQPWAKDVSFDNFCEYILPYRTSVEPVQNWRAAYARQFGALYSDAGHVAFDSVLLRVGQNIKSWFTNTYGTEDRKEPLPRLGALQLLHRKKGACEDIAGLACFMLRGNGYAASVDYVPAWATSSGLHYLNYVQTANRSRQHFDAADGIFMDTLQREPSKVIRSTFSRQSNTAASIVDTAQIPEGFMRLLNYKDVTREYWTTHDVPARLFSLKNGNPQIAFVSVLNYLQWKPVWWGKTSGDSTVFTNMAKGVVYLPMYYVKGKLLPAGWPVALGYNNTQVLQPDTIHKRTIRLTEQPKYLTFRTGKKYTLYFWENKWQKVSTGVPQPGSTEMVFDAVPLNALLLLLPEYTQGKERPFMITREGERIWF